MPENKLLLGYLTIIIGLASYSFYFFDIIRGKTKPEGFSWLIWGVLATITFFAQNSRGAGTGAWATLLTAIMCLIIAFVTFIRFPIKAKMLDGLSLVAAVSGLILWMITNDPLIAVLLVIVVGMIGFVPTFEKAFYKPGEETALTYFLNCVKFIVALFALESYNLVTILYPAALAGMNILLAGAIAISRRGRTARF